MAFSVSGPKVVISNTPPPVVQCRDQREASACEQLVSLIRRGQVPVLFVTKLPSGEHEVHARSGEFPTIKRADEVMREATTKLIASLIKKHVPAFDPGR